MTLEASCALRCKLQGFPSKQQLPVSGTRVVLIVVLSYPQKLELLCDTPRLRQCSYFPSRKRLLVHYSFHSMAALGQRKLLNSPCPSFSVRGSAWVWANPRDSSTFREGSAQLPNQGQHQQPCWHMLQDELRTTATGEAHFLSSCHFNANHTYTK